MGCLFARNVKKENEVDFKEKVYSWDLKKKNEDKNNFIIESLVNEERIELPGSVNGHQFLIQNCEDSSIYILDHTNTVTIYDCRNCKIILGPVKGSVYIGDCQNCIFVIACGQLRIRDSRKILAFVHCETQPVIEASSAISFGSYQLQYSQLEEHLKCANLDNKKKNWKVAYDFTPLQSETNWKFLENDNAYNYVEDPISSEAMEKLRSCGVSWCNIEEVPRGSEGALFCDG
ncbi:UNVERIFIED_CONTAM: hypothetical protein PYX00_000055 [Menopon gallinae]|uniref:C-CAP/cofactor C-like domain-containing protein n=1 Tax=Menopon gallinae TaxID=328185 RepID=A0AAW2I8C7_9NEOP